MQVYEWPQLALCGMEISHPHWALLNFWLPEKWALKSCGVFFCLFCFVFKLLSFEVADYTVLDNWNPLLRVQTDFPLTWYFFHFTKCQTSIFHYMLFLVFSSHLSSLLSSSLKRLCSSSFSRISSHCFWYCSRGLSGKDVWSAFTPPSRAPPWKGEKMGNTRESHQASLQTGSTH